MALERVLTERKGRWCSRAIAKHDGARLRRREDRDIARQYLTVGEPYMSYEPRTREQHRKPKTPASRLTARLPWRIVPPGRCNACAGTVYGDDFACRCGGAFCSWYCKYTHERAWERERPGARISPHCYRWPLYECGREPLG